MNKHHEYEPVYFISMIKQICYEFAELNHLNEPLNIVDAIEEAVTIVAHYEWRKKQPNLMQFPTAEKYWKERLAKLKNIESQLNKKNEDKV